jgi:hypothetical protein
VNLERQAIFAGWLSTIGGNSDRPTVQSLMPTERRTPLPPEHLPQAIGLLEDALRASNGLAERWRHQPVASTQMEAAEQRSALGDLEEARESLVVFERQREVWAALRLKPTQAADLEHFARLIQQYRDSLESNLRVAHIRQRQARAATGFEGFDEPARRDPVTGLYDQPIAHLPLIAGFIDENLADARSLLEDLKQAKGRPHVLDDATLDRVDEQYSSMAAENVRMHAWQLARWAALDLSSPQRVEVERLEAQLKSYKREATRVLKLSQKLREGVIERVLERDDASVGLEFLLDQARRRK